MFLRLVADSFGRRPRHKLLTGAALALGMAVATAALSVALDVGDRLAKEFRSLGANLLVTPQADSLPLEIGGVDYRPVNSGAYLPEADLGKLKTIFWHNNIVGFAPVLEVPVGFAPREAPADTQTGLFHTPVTRVVTGRTTLIGTWANHLVSVPDGSRFLTGADKTNGWWQVDGRWFTDGAKECILGRSFARSAGLKLGDTLQIETPKPGILLTVTGILTSGGTEDNAIVAPLAVAQKLADKPGVYRPLSVSALTKSVDSFAKRDADTRGPISAPALSVGSSAAGSVIERRMEIGLMKALGAGSGTVGFLLAAEQLLLAFVGGGAGYALGIILARLLGEGIFGAAPEPSLIVFLVVIALATGVTLLGSAIPLRRASRYKPAPILRGE